MAVKTMLAGRELDVLVAEKVMGFTRLEGAAATGHRHYGEPDNQQLVWVSSDGEEVYCRFCGNMPAYSTDIAAAWRVVEKLYELGCSVEVWLPNKEVNTTHLRIAKVWKPSGGWHRADAFTAPRAICLAALEAFGGATHG